MQECMLRLSVCVCVSVECVCVCVGMHVECMDCMWTGFVLPLLKAPAADGL